MTASPLLQICTHILTTDTHAHTHMHTHICDPLQENRPLADFRKISVLGVNRLEIYRRVQRSSYRAQNRFIRRVTALKLYTGSPSLRIQFYEKRSILCAHGVPYTVRVIMNSSTKTANGVEVRAITSPVVGVNVSRKRWKIHRVTCQAACLTIERQQYCKSVHALAKLNSLRFPECYSKQTTLYCNEIL